MQRILIFPFFPDHETSNIQSTESTESTENIKIFRLKAYESLLKGSTPKIRARVFTNRTILECLNVLVSLDNVEKSWRYWALARATWPDQPSEVRIAAWSSV
ncbi:hypothetical protein HK096_010485, partial [Nowakowskiella sp. JEL0078]